MLDSRLEVRIYNDYNKATLLDVLTDKVEGLQFSTALHGGFKDCRLSIPLDLAQSWLYLHRENVQGRHFAHLEINEGSRTVWEGRIMEVELRVERGFRGLSIKAMGYWNSCRDRYYDAGDTGNTDWTTGGPHTIDDIIKELLTKECPDINSNQSNIAASTSDVEGLVLTDRDYPQNIIIDSLAPLVDDGDAPWYFAIWEDRIPYWAERAITSPIDWQVWLRDLSSLRLAQSAIHLRNAVLPVVGTTEGTAASDTDSQTLYPVRDVILNLPTGIPTASANQARDSALTERKLPRQSTAFAIDGRVYDSQGGALAAAGAIAEAPLWRVRAGDTIRIQDLVPFSASSPTLDDVRTFYILETRYNASRNSLQVQPDRPTNDLGSIMARLNLIERNKSLG